MERVLVGLFALCLAGCGGSGDSGSADSGTIEGTSFEGAALTEPSDGACPKLDRPGERSFSSGGLDREVIVHFPKNPEPGLPVVFVWHGLGDSAAGIDAALRLEDFADDNQAVVVVPQSTDPLLLTWDIGSGGKDATLFDDMRTCLARELDVDLTRIHTTGFSFGALFATWLAMERADSLASAVVMSGGTDAGIGLGYRKPATDIPVLVMWGGDGDVFDGGLIGLDFAAASEDFSSHLIADGHVVALCDHGRGHALPPDYSEAMTPWLLKNRYGEASPFATALPDFPSWCSAAR